MQRHPLHGLPPNAPFTEAQRALSVDVGAVHETNQQRPATGREHPTERTHRPEDHTDSQGRPTELRSTAPLGSGFHAHRKEETPWPRTFISWYPSGVRWSGFRWPPAYARRPTKAWNGLQGG